MIFDTGTERAKEKNDLVKIYLKNIFVKLKFKYSLTFQVFLTVK